MGTTIAGNQHIGSNYAQYQYLWKPGSSGDYGTVELYEENRIFVYQFNPIYDQRDDGVLAVEFYYYYRKPTSEKFYEYCYYAEDFYIYPFLAWYDEDGEDGGAWGGIMTSDSQKISLVGRDTGWIHVTLHVDEYIWGRFTNNGKTFDNTIYIGVYSPILVLNWDTSSANASGGVVPYEIFWNFDEYEDDTVYDLMTGGYLEDCYDGRRQINDYPSFYITYRDITPESFAYAVNETAVMNVSSGITKKANFKKMLAEIKAACTTNNRKLIAKRNGGRDSFSINTANSRKEIFKRSFSETNNAVSVNTRKQSLFKNIAETPDIVSLKNRKLEIKLSPFSESIVPDSDTLRMLEIKKSCSSVARGTSSFIRKLEYIRNNLIEAFFPASSILRRNHLKTEASSILTFDDEHDNRMFFNRLSISENQITDSLERKVDWKRLMEITPDAESEVLREQVLFRSAESQSDFTARPFASRLFFRTVQTVMSLWDWIRGKIREANNVVTFFCPIHLEIEMECRI